MLLKSDASVGSVSVAATVVKFQRTTPRLAPSYRSSGRVGVSNCVGDQLYAVAGHLPIGRHTQLFHYPDGSAIGRPSDGDDPGEAKGLEPVIQHCPRRFSCQTTA